KTPIATLETAIRQALSTPVEIERIDSEIIHPAFTTNCAAWEANKNPVTHFVNSANPGTGAPTGSSFVSLIYDSLYVWQALSNSWITLRVGGTTTRPATANFDGNNDVAWGNLTGTTLGVNSCATVNNVRVDSDTIFDNTGQNWTTTGEGGKMDLRSTAEHEFGHGIGIGHSNVGAACDLSANAPLMCAATAPGVRAVIQTDDSNAANHLYPLSGGVPAAPSNLVALISGSTSSLTWADNSNNELAFEVQRAPTNCAGTFKGVATLPANTTSYNDNDYGVGLNGAYCYRVKALNQGGDSGFSANVLASVSDNLTNSFGVTAFPLTASNVNLSTATGETNETTCSNAVGGMDTSSIWYKITPTSNGKLSVTVTPQNDDDVTLGLFTGTTHPLTRVLCADAGTAGGEAEMITSQAITASNTYYVRVAVDSTYNPPVDLANVSISFVSDGMKFYLPLVQK
ncbi:MAG: matrixin family metalloprotease, partial [Chloroflexota bacterium]